MKSIDYIIAVLGGLGSITGTIIAAVVLGIIQHVSPKCFKPSYDYLRLGFDSCNALRPGGLAEQKELYLSKFFNKSKGK